MERVTACVDEHDGSVVDFYGDGVLVMWNAPTAQDDHAVRACQAALAIQAAVPSLADTWSELAGTPLKLRCTLNSGPALVGNTGTRQRVGQLCGNRDLDPLRATIQRAFPLRGRGEARLRRQW